MIFYFNFMLFFCVLKKINNIESFKNLVKKYLINGNFNDAYLSYKQFLEFNQEISKNFSNIIKVNSIGKTYEENEIPIYEFLNNKQSNKNGIIFTGMHHGREPVSMMMNLYLLLHLLSLPEAHLSTILNETNIYIIPCINIDGYKYNSEKFEETKNISKCFIRKNRRPPPNDTRCDKEDIGVDLNRNYGYFFGIDNKGSSNKPCEEDYRGTEPFSEPETLNIKNFVENHSEIKIAINYHSYGNLIITPFNYLPFKESLEKIEKEFNFLSVFYKEFEIEAKYPNKFVFGNGDKTINYLSNGDATDWFISKNILSFSPELGTENKKTETFYPNKIETFEILEKFLYSSVYAIQKSMYYLNLKLLKCEINQELKNLRNSNNANIFCNFSIGNYGFGDFNKKENITITIYNYHKQKIINPCFWENGNKNYYCNKNNNEYYFKFNISKHDFKSREEFIFNLNLTTNIKNINFTKNSEFIFYLESSLPIYKSNDINSKFILWKFNNIQIELFSRNFLNREKIQHFISNENYNYKNLIICLIFIISLIIISFILYRKYKQYKNTHSNVINLNTVNSIKIPTNEENDSNIQANKLEIQPKSDVEVLDV